MLGYRICVVAWNLKAFLHHRYHNYYYYYYIRQVQCINSFILLCYLYPEHLPFPASTRGSANVQKSCGVGLRTLHQWRASSPRRWKIENGGTNNKLPICSPYAAAPIQKQAHHLFTLCPLLGTYSSGFQVPHHT